MNDPTFHYELYFDLSPDLLCIAGYDGFFKKINHAVSKTLGYTMEELYSRPINDFIYQDDKDITEFHRRELIRSKPLYNFENRYQTKSGEIVWLSWTSFPIESDQVIFAIAKDITHKKKIEEERIQLLANLTKTNKDLKQLTYSTSHDLRSPISSLLSCLDLIDPSKIADPDTIELFEVLKLSGDYVKKTLDNYVDTLNQKHNAIASLEEIDLTECLNNVLKPISSLIQTSKTSIHFDFTNAGKLNFNKSYMESIFLNLISNSIKYAKPHEFPVIKIATEKNNGGTKLFYQDNGLGFDLDKVKDKIFGFNQTFHNHQDSKGIGLYLVYNHVTNLGGKIDVVSKVNEGTKFIITFKD